MQELDLQISYCDLKKWRCWVLMVLKMVARDTMMKTNDWCILFNQKLLRKCHGGNAESLELSDSDMAISEGGLVEQNTAQIFFSFSSCDFF